MPLYDLACDKCDEVYEVFVPLKDFDKTIECPECKGALRREMPHLKSYQVKVN